MLELWVIKPAGQMNNYVKHVANQNCRHGFKIAGKHQKAEIIGHLDAFSKV